MGMTMNRPSLADRLLRRASFGAIIFTTVLAAILGSTGCSTRVKVLARDSALPEHLASGSLIAIGGITVCPTVGGILAPDDALAAAAVVLHAFSNVRPDLRTCPLPMHPGEPATVLWAKMADEYGNLGRLRPDQLVRLADDLGDCRLLALGRLVDDEIRTRTSHPQAPAPAAGSSASEETGHPWTTTVSTERRITLTLEIFDIRTGASLWKARSEARARAQYRYEDRLRIDPEGYLQERLSAADSPAFLDRRGQYLKLPDLIDLMEQGLSAALQKLP